MDRVTAQFRAPVVGVAEQFFKCITHPADKTGSVCEKVVYLKN